MPSMQKEWQTIYNCNSSNNQSSRPDLSLFKEEAIEEVVQTGRNLQIGDILEMIHLMTGILRKVITVAEVEALIGLILVATLAVM